uniref:Anti-repressor protein n=1 Tax=Bartonella schoenbuchensis (strain DSM 13525 / NCTC 13165 / R1) TaxID=687861 RepID=E6YZ68_BARSR
MNFLFDKITEAFIYANQVLNKHLKCIADRLPRQSFFRKLKALTHCMRVAYSDLVGCGYAIQYPHGKSITTDYAPCLLTPGALLGVINKHLTA